MLTANQAMGMIETLDIAVFQVNTESTLSDRTSFLRVQNFARSMLGRYAQAALGMMRRQSPLATIAARHRATPAQIALAWLLRRSDVMLPIPGTSRRAHLQANAAASAISLTDDEFAALSI